jgi:hypothetical protein
MAIAQNINLTQDKEAARLETIADLKSKRITEWLSAREFDAHILFENPLYAVLYREAQATRAGHANLMTKLDEFISIRRFSAASVLSPEGNLLWHTPDAGGLSAQLRTALKDAKSGSITRVGPYLDEQGQARLDFIAPLPMAGDKSPFIVLQISRSDWLNNILKSWPVPDSSGEALLFRRSGDQIQFLNDVRYRPGSALTLHLPVSSKELLAAQFLQQSRNEEGKALFFGKDYRNTPVFGTVQPVMGTDWYLLAKIDKAELTRAELKESIWIGLIGLLVLLIANTGIVLLRQHTRLQMAEQVASPRPAACRRCSCSPPSPTARKMPSSPRTERANTSCSIAPPASLSANRPARCWVRTTWPSFPPIRPAC